MKVKQQERYFCFSIAENYNSYSISSMFFQLQVLVIAALVALAAAESPYTKAYPTHHHAYPVPAYKTYDYVMMSCRFRSVLKLIF